jgi:hypothetical protein
MSCRLKRAIGSGYSKQSTGSKELDQAVAKLKEAREALDAKYYPQLESVIQRTEPPDCSNSLVSTSNKR